MRLYYRFEIASLNLIAMSSPDVINAIESIIQRDEGDRGIKDIFLKGELYSSAEAVLKCNSIVIITGFPCLLDYNPPTETDGPLGAVAIARSLIVLGKKVTILTDECNEEVMLACVASSGIRADKLVLESFPGRGTGFDESDLNRLIQIGRRCEAVIAIERAGPNIEGACLTMRKRDMSDIVAPLELLFDLDFLGDCRNAPSAAFDDDDDEEAVGECPLNEFGFVRVGIGDGGNEVGMGKILERICASTSIPNAAEIACVTTADHLIVASVSNWGGYALAAAIASLAADKASSIFLESTQTQQKPLTQFETQAQASVRLHPEFLRRLQQEDDTAEMDTYEYRVLRLLREKDAEEEDQSGSVACASSVGRRKQYIDVCLPTLEDECAMLAAMNAEGARDGITQSVDGMVDGMPIQRSLDILEEIRLVATDDNFNSSGTGVLA